MFEVNPSRKINKSDIKNSDEIINQQRVFLNEPQDTLDLSTKKQKQEKGLGATIKGIVSFMGNRFNSFPISSKAIQVLEKNNIITKDFTPETSLVDSEENLTDMPVAFQRKLAIDMTNEQSNHTKEIFKNNELQAKIKFNENGKPSKIEYFSADKLTKSEEFDYAMKQDGSFVLVKDTIYNHKDNVKSFENEINFHKHKNGAVTISSSDGKTMSYSLRKETIQDYNNTADKPQKQNNIIQNKQTDNTISKPPRETFVKPRPTYQTQDYSEYDKKIIDNKFDILKKEHLKYNDPNSDHADFYVNPVFEDLDKLKSLVLNIKDPTLQKAAMNIIQNITGKDLKTDYVGYFLRLNFYDNKEPLTQLLNMGALSITLNNEIVELDDNDKLQVNYDKILPYPINKHFQPSFDELDKTNKIIESINENDKISVDEKNNLKNEIVHNEFLSSLGTIIDKLSHSNPNLKNYLSETYLKPNLPPEQAKDLDRIEKVQQETIIPRKYSNFTFETLRNFSNLPEIAKKHFLLHPEMCQNCYLYEDNLLGIETPYETLSTLNEDEWEIYEKRNLNKYLDVLTGFNISTFDVKLGKNISNAINMSDSEWEKLKNFNLLNLHTGTNSFKVRENEDMQFNFEQMQDILEKMSYNDWETAKNRGLIDMSCECMSKYNNYGRNIGVPIIVASAKAPDSTFKFLNQIELFKNNKLNLTNVYNANLEKSLDNIATGIEFLGKSHNDVYQHINELRSKGFSPDISMEILGICAEKYNKFGNYLTQKTIELKDKGLQEREIPNVLPMYIDLQITKNKSDINELSIEEKRSLLKNLIKYNSMVFQDKYSNLINSNILPKNKDEYCSLLPKLIKAIGIDTRPVSQETIDNFDNSMKEMSNKNSEFMTTKITKDSLKLDLNYSRKDFINDVAKITKYMPETEKMKVFDYFGFDLKYDRTNNLQLHGYPTNLNNESKLSDIKDTQTQRMIEEIRPLVERFSNNNKVTIAGKPELTKEINSILELFPELRTTIGKVQHGTHDYTVDVHTLKVLQNVMSDERYSTLSDNDKKILNIAAILHDLTKAENVADPTHASYSAYDSYHLLKKMNMSEKDKTRVYQIIKNHEWLSDYNAKVKINDHASREKTYEEKEKTAKDIAFELKDDNNFELTNILTKADLKGVKENDEFYNKYANVYNEATRRIAPLVDMIQETAIHLPQTKLPKASELKVDGKNVQEISTKDSNGNIIKNKVIFLSPQMDLGAIGFEKGLNSDDFNVIVHGLDENTQSATFQALGSVDSDSLLSTSYVNYKKGNYKVFRPQGFILDVNSQDIQAGTNRDFGSGYGKNLETLKSEYLFNGRRKSIRNYMSNMVKEKLNINDKEYKQLFPEIADKSITELDKTRPDVSKAMREILAEMVIHQRKYGRNYNEWLISRPKIQGIFLEGDKYQNITKIPDFLAKYAEDNDLPIVYFGE